MISAVCVVSLLHKVVGSWKKGLWELQSDLCIYTSTNFSFEITRCLMNYEH